MNAPFALHPDRLLGPDPATRAIARELKKFSPELAARERWLVLNKMDLLPPAEAEKRCKEIVRRLRWKGPVYRISGVFFFGAAASIGAVLDRIGDANRALIVDFSAVPFVDSTAARTMESLARNLGKRGAKLSLTGATASVRRDFDRNGLEGVLYRDSVEAALVDAREL